MAWMIGRRFEIACEKAGLNKRRSKLTTDHFARPKTQRAAARCSEPAATLGVWVLRKLLSIVNCSIAGPMTTDPRQYPKTTARHFDDATLILRTATEPDIPIMHERILGNSEVMRYVFRAYR